MANGGSLCQSSDMASSEDETADADSSCRPDIIDGFERKSVALLDYVNRLEAQFEEAKTLAENREARLRADKKALEEDFSDREFKLKAEKKALEEKLQISLDQLSRAHKALVQEERKCHAVDQAARDLKLDLRAAQDLLRNERQRAKELEEQLSEVKEQLRNRELAHSKRRLKDERERIKLEDDLRNLKKKVSLGWIFGCLSEIYLRQENESDAELGVKVVGQLFKDDGTPSKLESIEREVRRLIDNLRTSHLQKPIASLVKKVGDTDLEPACRPCRYIRSIMETEHEYHHHQRSRSVSPTVSHD